MSEARELRRIKLAERDRLEQKTASERSQAIADRLLALPEVQKSPHVFVYVSFRSEVVTDHIIRHLLTQGHQVSVPLTLVKEKRLDLIAIKDPDSELVPGYCGIPEPKEELLDARRVTAESIDCILLPGSVFDERGGRFGYGGGYYDRLLAAVPAATRIGLAFDLQVVERAPLAPHDELLDLVVTESRIIRGRR